MRANIRLHVRRRMPMTYAMVARLLFCTGLLHSVAGCGEKSAPLPKATTVSDSVGIRIVESREPVWTNGTGWHLPSEPMLDIGADTELYQVSGALRLPEGRIAVTERYDVLIFDSDGELLVRGGGEGDGPGEFHAIRGLAVTADTLLIFDASLGRVSTFSLDGTWIESHTLTPPSDTVRLGEYSLAGLISDSLILVPSSPSPDFRRLGSYETSRASISILAYSRTGELLGPFARPAGQHYYYGDRFVLVPPFRTPTSAAVGGGRLYLGDGEGYEVEAWDAAGHLRQLMRRPVEPKPVTEADLNEWFDATLGDVPAEGREAAEEPFRKAGHAPTKPLYTRLMADVEGNLWVQESPTRWSVLDSAGLWLGEVDVPERFEPHDIGSDYLLGVWHDELDIEHVRVYALVK